ncbi:hypothetical protein [Saccharothrix deserti]|uniref:hypothetical protein n=1 Tax=Saccharothrix deserti TaxID=2593674 RepID=UPI00131E5E60|nr:hypothetical protein [Saccharothrix deserti]
MTAILFALTVVALVVYGLERNHQRQIRLGSRLAGSTDVDDRDLPRVQRELHATAVHSTPPRAVPRLTISSVHPV